MAFHRYALAILIPSLCGLCVGLTACSQLEPSAADPSDASALAPNESESSALASSDSKPDSPAPNISQSNILQSNILQSEARAASRQNEGRSEVPTRLSQVTSPQASLRSCTRMVAYDPEDSSVNLRDRPDGQVIATVSNLTPVAIQRWSRSNWNEASVSEANAREHTRGYIWGDLVRFSRYQVEDPEDATANIRTAPNGEIIATLANGTKVTFLGIEGDWTQIEMDNGYSGYITTSRLASTGTLDC